LALKLNPDSAECYFNLASAQFDKGSYDQAKVNFWTAHELNDKNPETNFQLGLIAEQEATRALKANQPVAGEFVQQAVKHFNDTLALDKSHEKAKLALTRVQAMPIPK